MVQSSLDKGDCQFWTFQISKSLSMISLGFHPHEWQTCRPQCKTTPTICIHFTCAMLSRCMKLRVFSSTPTTSSSPSALMSFAELSTERGRNRSEHTRFPSPNFCLESINNVVSAGKVPIRRPTDSLQKSVRFRNGHPQLY